METIIGLIALWIAIDITARVFQWVGPMVDVPTDFEPPTAAKVAFVGLFALGHIVVLAALLAIFL